MITIGNESEQPKARGASQSDLGWVRETARAFSHAPWPDLAPQESQNNRRREISGLSGHG